MALNFLRKAIVAIAIASLTVNCASVEKQAEADARQSPEQDTIAIGKRPIAERTAQDEIMYRLLAGELAGHMGDIQQSTSHYSQAAELSDDPTVAERATRIALFGSDSTQAVDVASRWVQLAPNNLEARQTLAVLYVRNGQSQKAIPHFEYVINSPELRGGKGYLLVGATLAKEKDQQSALDAMRLLVERHEDSPWAYFALANLALNAKQNRLAADASAKALEIDPNLVDALIVRARALQLLGETEQALNDMRTAVTARPDSFELRANYGRLLVQVKSYDEARAVFEELTREQPQKLDLLYTLGLLNMQAERYDAAEVNFKRLVSTGKRTDVGHYYLGRVAEKRERYKRAMSWYQQVEEGEYYLDAQTRVAELQVKLGNMDKARAHFKKLRDQASDADTAIKLYLAEGQLLREQADYHAGLEMYSRALTEHPGNGDLLYARALMAEKIDRIDLLEADLRAILAEDPDNATALNALGYTLADRNQRIPEAYEYIQRALEVRPDDPTVIDSMGWVYYRMGEYDKAEKYLRKAYELLQDAEVAGHLSEIVWVRGNKEEARRLLKKALDKDPDNDYLLKLKQRFFHYPTSQTQP